MVRGFTRKGRLKKALADLRLNLGTAPVVFAGGVIERFEDLGQKLEADDIEVPPPTYRRMMVREGSPHLLSRLSELLLILEGCAFYVHLVDRLAFRRDSEGLRDACDGPAGDAIELVARMIGSANDEDPLPDLGYKDVLRIVNARGAAYAAARSIIGPDSEDPSGVVALAAMTIAQSVNSETASVLRTIVSVCLLESIERDDWSRARGRGGG